MVAEGRAFPPSLLGLGIGVGKDWEVVLEYGIGGKDVGYKNVTLWVQNIRTITSLREGFGGKSPLFLYSQSAYYLRVSYPFTSAAVKSVFRLTTVHFVVVGYCLYDFRL